MGSKNEKRAKRPAKLLSVASGVDPETAVEMYLNVNLSSCKDQWRESTRLITAEWKKARRSGPSTSGKALRGQVSVATRRRVCRCESTRSSYESANCCDSPKPTKGPSHPDESGCPSHPGSAHPGSGCSST